MKKEYIIESPHTKEECLKALDETLAKGSKNLSKFHWGCQAGEHTGWAIVKADSKAGAKDIVPPTVRNRAQVFETSKVTPNQIKAYHSM